MKNKGMKRQIELIGNESAKRWTLGFFKGITFFTF